MKRELVSTLFAATALFASCSEMNKEVKDKQDVTEIASADTAVMYGDDLGIVEADGAEIIQVNDTYWESVNLNAPVVKEVKLKDKDIEIRRGDTYDIYGLEERILFDVDKATLRPEAEAKLKSIAASIKELSPRGPIRIYGFTDAQASASYNKELSEDRAQAVKNWLQKNGGIDSTRMSIEPMGEAAPRASNKTAQGRQQNRRVAIAVATQQKAQEKPEQPSTQQ